MLTQARIAFADMQGFPRAIGRAHMVNCPHKVSQCQKAIRASEQQRFHDRPITPPRLFVVELGTVRHRPLNAFSELIESQRFADFRHHLPHQFGINMRYPLGWAGGSDIPLPLIGLLAGVVN
jgi:hypothetical protein